MNSPTERVKSFEQPENLGTKQFCRGLLPFVKTAFPISVFILGASLFGCSATTIRPTSVLPLKTLHLYETGVGYFERSGEVKDGPTSLPVPAGHLDDALKTLVIVGASGAKVQALTFASSLSTGLARAHAGLPLDASKPVTFVDLLLTLKGTNVEVGSGSTKVEGRLVDVIEPPPIRSKSKDGKEETTTQPPELLILTADGTIRRLTGDILSRVRGLDETWSARMAASLDSLGTRAAQLQKHLELLRTGGGVGPTTFGYVAETPIFRPSYRLVLDDTDKAGKAALQGWALLHNDTDEDWKGVSVKLVSGRPDSFLFPLAAPRYSRRPLIHPETELSTVPQLLLSTPDKIWGDHADDGTVTTYGSGSGTGYGSGGGGGRVGSSRVARSPTFLESVSDLLKVGDLSALGTDPGVESGALFSYPLGSSIDLKSHASALVPFLSSSLDISFVTHFAGPSASARSAIRFVNSTGQTLPAGTLAVFGGGTFAGETAIDRSKPGDKRFLTFGADLDVGLEERDAKSEDSTKRLTFERGRFLEHFLRIRKVNWRIESRAGKPRTVYVEVSVVKNGKLEGADEVDILEDKPVALIKVAARTVLTRPIVITEGLDRSTDPATITLKDFEAIRSRSADVPMADKVVLDEALSRRREVEEAQELSVKTTAEMALVEKEIERLREHLKAMGDKGATPATNPFVTRILAAEDRLTALRKKREAHDLDAKTKLISVRTALEKLKR